MKRTGIRSVSKKRLASGEVSTGSTFRKVSSRSRPMTPGGTITSKKPIKKSNPERQAKRRKSYAQKLTAYHRSETYKIVEDRAGGQCERFIAESGLYLQNVVDGKTVITPVGYRCPATDGLSHNHLRYARLGGKELPSDVEVLCQFHHDQYESLKPVHRARRSAT